MVHFSCDLCGKKIKTDHDQRYVVKIEAYAVRDPAEITEADLDEDHMEAVSKIIRDLDESGEEIEDPRKKFRFDLCPDCHQRFVTDPLGKDQLQKLTFSKN